MVFLITGGSRGIGKAIVLDAARAGHDVAFTYATKPDLAREVEQEARQAAPTVKVKAYELDVRKSADVDAVVDEIVMDFDTVNVLVNNAGINRPGLAMSMSDEDWKDVIETNLTGSFFMVRAVLPHFLANGGGSFIHVSSIASYGISGQLSYCAAKAGLLGMSRGLAKEYGSKNVRSNVLMLGLFDTDMVREGLSQANRDFWLKYCPLQRFGDVREISQLCVYLASDAAGFINGQEITLTGGLEHAT
jgi:NAD(P)-dependent dehydrogenase (short-subunit alcohol dehydrogenase family)